MTLAVKRKGESYAQYLTRQQRKIRNGEVNVTVQLCEDAAIIAANEILHLGPSRVIDFMNCYRKTVNEIARVSTSDDDIDYAKVVIDRRLQQIMGDQFIPWDDRYDVKIK